MAGCAPRDGWLVDCSPPLLVSGGSHGIDSRGSREGSQRVEAGHGLQAVGQVGILVLELPLYRRHDPRGQHRLLGPLLPGPDLA